MVPKKHRLKEKKDFDYVYKHGKKAFSSFFVLIAAPQERSRIGPEATLPRFGFVASSKVGKAVERNNAKRLMREATRKELPFLNRNFDAVIVTFQTISTADGTTLHEALKKALNELNLYRKSE